MTRILGLMHDLFFRSKVDAVSHAMGIEVVYASSLDEANARCAEEAPAMIFVDLADPTLSRGRDRRRDARCGARRAAYRLRLPRRSQGARRGARGGIRDDALAQRVHSAPARTAEIVIAARELLAPVQFIDAHRKMSVAAKPSAERTACNLPHCSTSRATCRSRVRRVDSFELAVGRHDDEERVGPVGNQDDRAEKPAPVLRLPPRQ